MMKLAKNNSIISPLSMKKKLGAFYTPYELCEVLTNWAIVSPSDTVLEPSFGQCGFLEASKQRFLNLGCKQPANQIYGCDIDPTSFIYLKKVLGDHINKRNFLKKDFMKILPNSIWGNSFNASVGNPPYISSHNLSMAQKKDYCNRWNSLGFTVTRRASLWAHFLIHAVSFIAEKGRIAWVLPGSFLHTDYANEIRKYISANFSESICILMEQRFFIQEGTEEETVILLAKNKSVNQNRTNEICYANAINLQELEGIIDDWDNNKWNGQHLTAKPSYLYASTPVITAFNKILLNKLCMKLGNLLNINIGIVTGASTFFVINQEVRKLHKITKRNLKPILARASFAKGLNFSLDDHKTSIKKNNRGYLINIKSFSSQNPLAKYLASYPKEEIKKNKTFQKRKIWHAPDDNLTPDAFLSAMNHMGPKMIINSANINCTNTIYRVFFNKKIKDIEKKLIAISLLTNFSQLSAEFTGRRYGSGVLKHEPTEMKNIAILFPPNIAPHKVEIYFNKIDIALRNNEENIATQLADQLIMSTVTNGEQLSIAFYNELKKIRARRQRIKPMSLS